MFPTLVQTATNRNKEQAVCITHGPLARYVKLRVTHAPGMPGTFSPPWRISDPDMRHARGAGDAYRDR